MGIKISGKWEYELGVEPGMGRNGNDSTGVIPTHCILQVNSALHPSGVAKSSTSFGWGKGGKVTSAGWQVTLCDLIWHVISRSGVVISITNCYFTLLLL